MRVVLLKDVSKIGRAGEIKEVANGLARNYLLPRQLAVLATSDAVATAEKIMLARAQGLSAKKAAIAKALFTLKVAPLIIRSKANAKGHLFAAIREDEILRALVERGISLPARALKINEPIKEIGPTTIEIGGQPITLLVEPLPEADV